MCSTGCPAACMVNISPIESGDSFAVMAISPGVFLLAGFRAAVVIAFGARAKTLIAQESEFQIAGVELSFG